MHAPGVEVRPLRQITGEAEFNEIFMTDVRVPVANVLGEIGDGWAVAMTTLLHERATLGFALTTQLDVNLRRLVALARERGADDPLVRDRVAREWIDLQGLRFTNLRALTALVQTGMPGPEGSGVKLAWSEQNQRLTKLAPRAARPGVAAPRRGGRLLAAPAAAQPRQHDRGRHLRDPPEHHRRARARPSQEPSGPFRQDTPSPSPRSQAQASPAPLPRQPALVADACGACLRSRPGS